MNKLEEIKKRLEDAKRTDWRIKSHVDEQGQTHVNWEDLNEYNLRLVAHATADMGYLLSIIEQAEKALEQISNLDMGSLSFPHVEIALEALQAIRGK